MASPVITTGRLPSKSDNGAKPYRPSSSRGIHLPPISLQNSSNESAPQPEPAAECLRELLPPMQERLHSAMEQLSSEVNGRRFLASLTACRTMELFVPLWHGMYTYNMHFCIIASYVAMVLCCCTQMRVNICSSFQHVTTCIFTCTSAAGH